jgi:hypothetical protein
MMNKQNSGILAPPLPFKDEPPPTLSFFSSFGVVNSGGDKK